MADTCIYCNADKNDDLVQCDSCDSWVHFTCAGVTKDVENQDWKCESCVAAEKQQSSHEFQTPTTSKYGTTEGTKGMVGQEAATGVKQVSDDYSRGSHVCLVEEDVELELLQLEEIKNVELKTIEKKFEILRNKAISNQKIEHFPKPTWRTKYTVNKENLPQHTEASCSNNVENKVETHSQHSTHTTRQSVDILSYQQLSTRNAVPRDLPIFTGKPEEWLVFISSFENSTRMCGFTNDENLLRLQRALKGKAFECVSSKLMIPALVPEIMATLKMMFGRPEQIINIILSKIRMHPAVNLNKLDTLITFALELKNLTAAMEATGLEAYYNNPMLVQEFIEKLPVPMRLEWGRHRGKNCLGDLKLLCDWLYEQAETASTVSSVSTCGEIENRRKIYRLNFHNENGKFDQSKQQVLACYSCGKNHMLVNCEAFVKATHDDKWKQVNKLNLCYICLKKHNSKFCKNRTECGVNGCTKKHHMLLHKPEKRNDSDALVIATHHQETSSMLYKVIPVTIFGDGTSCDIYAFLDDGSGPTLIEKSVLQSIRVKSEKKDLCLKWTDGTTRVVKDSDIIQLPVSRPDNPDKKYLLRNVRSVDRLDLPIQTLNMEEIAEKYKHLRGLPVKSYANIVPRMIIGINNKDVTMPLKYREGHIGEPAATKTRLGWTIYGALDDKTTTVEENMQLHICECDDDVALHKLVADNMKIEVSSENNKQQNTKAQSALQNVIKCKGDHYVTKLLWNSPNERLPDNYNMALQRLKCFERKLNKDPELGQKVNNHIQDMIYKGYVRKLTPNEIADEHPRKWYLPIFTVQNPNKPKKIRVVWDAAAKHNGLSLNDCLKKGPDMLNSLVSVLFNFRVGKVGVCGDICEMFHRVHVDVDDQQSQRFLWRNCKEQTPDVYVLCVLSFGASCSPALAQYVKNSNALRFNNEYPRAVKSITERHYVDDMLDSVDTIDEAITLAKEVRDIHGQGNFHIRNWLSNSRKVIDALGEQGEPEVFLTAGKRVDQFIEPSKVLGMWWKTDEDVFTFNLRYTKTNEEILKGTRLPTKRELLRLLMSIFDPLGLLSFYLIDMKILFQKIWRCGIAWDDEIPKEFGEYWYRWLKILTNVVNVAVPRHYFGPFSHKDCNIDLHIFVDASESAYAAVAYFRFQQEETVQLALIGSKAKVAPLRPISIPRMELMAAVLGVRFGEIILKHHDVNISHAIYWSDSKTVLAWVRSEPSNYKQFVMYRIGEIQESTSADQWRYVPTKLNIADLATKLTTNPEIDPKGEWFSGPPFLLTSKNNWPKQQKESMRKEGDELRTKKEFHMVACQTEVDSGLIDVQRFSKWERLLRCLAYVKLFIKNVKNKVASTKEKSSFSKQTILTNDELLWSHNKLCQLAQNEKFAKEIKALENNIHMKKHQAFRKLSPFIDESQLLRMRGRLENAQFLNNERKFPIILPRKHKITRLLVDWYHRKAKHVHHETVINEMFQRYQIPGLRTVLRSVRYGCHDCKIRNACPQPPEMGQLPIGRLSPFCRPFTHVGLDFFGPFHSIIGRRAEKRYGVVFTCMTCRAIHIEMAYTLNTSSCIITIRNFIARRGTPTVFYSDNGTNLKASEKELRESMRKIKFEDLQKEFISTETKWEFIPPASPHMGGTWERMVRTIKHVMYQIITPDTKLNDERLNNLFIEIEHIVNSRPLTYLSLDTAEQEALTPNHFLLGSSSGSKPPGEFDSRDQYVKRSWRYSQFLADKFWKRWVAEMLPELTKRPTWHDKAEPLQEGDIVIIVDPNSPRYSWPKGVIIQVMAGKDGQTRSAIVRTARGQYHRPTTKLAKLNINHNLDELAK